MLQTHSTVEPGNSVAMPLSTDESAHKPRSLRHEIAECVRQGRIAQARQMAQNALSEHPGQEDVLVIHALVCEMQHDWAEAEKSLHHLVQMQMPSVTEETWRHWIRVLQCTGRVKEALEAACTAVQQHPASLSLKSELESLRTPPASIRAAA